MIKKILKRAKNNKGESLVSLVIIIPIIVALIVTMIDGAAYFMNRSLITNTARDGARTIAIFGGNGTGSEGTALEVKYGLKRANTCDKLTNEIEKMGKNSIVSSSAVTSESTPTECNTMLSLENSSGLINVTVHDVTCTPQITSSIGERTSCEIDWEYGSIPGSGFSFFTGTDKNSDGTSKNALQNNVTSGSSESEVDLSGSYLISRGD